MQRPPDFPAHIRAAIFDFDETLIDLEALHTTAYEALCREMRSDYERAPDGVRLASGRRIIDEIRDMREWFGWQEPVESLFAKRQSHFMEALRDSRLDLLPGAESVVRALRARGIRLAIATSAVRDAVIEALRRVGLRDRFEVILDGSEVEHGKPDPEIYLKTAHALAVEPRFCVVFEDSRVGVLAAKAAGMYCIAVPNPGAQTSQDVSAADLQLGSLEEFDPSWVE